jgi:transposase, IS5 family
MLWTRAPEVSLWETVLPDEVLRLPEELARVDALLGDPAFFAPFAPFFDPRVGCPSTPMEVYLRLIFLKFRYRLGYDSLCREVADSIICGGSAGSRWTGARACDAPSRHRQLGRPWSVARSSLRGEPCAGQIAQQVTNRPPCRPPHGGTRSPGGCPQPWPNCSGAAS